MTVHRSFVLVLLVTQATACMTWRPVTSSGGDLAPEYLSPPIRVVRLDSTVVVLEEVTARGDSISGRAEDGAPVSVAMADVEALQVQRFDPVSIIVALPAIVAAVLVVTHLPLGGDEPFVVDEGRP